MTSLIPYISTRGVRSLNAFHFKAPYLFVKKGSRGQRKIGPMYYEKNQWPGQQREFPELSPKFMKLNPEELHNYTGVSPVGYRDEVTGNFVVIKEMLPELIVPDLTDFELKPYVSYSVDDEIDSRWKKYLVKLQQYGSEKLADLHTNEDERWPPPPMKPKTLFDLLYKKEIMEKFAAGKYDKKS